MSALPHAARALRLLLGWVLLTALTVGLGLLLTHAWAGSVGVLDDRLARWTADQRRPVLDALAWAGTWPAGFVVGGVLLLLEGGLAAARVRARWPLLLVMTSYAGVLATYVVVTHLVPRQRPPVRILQGGLVPDHSYPSGHTMTMVCVAGCAGLLLRACAGLRWWWVPAAVLVPLTALARLYQGAHHLTDVLAAVLVTVAWLAVVARVLPLSAASTDPARSHRAPSPGPAARGRP